ncbi:MAG: leucine--tRNA ligase [Candidatus Latescibacterota bacterium]
MSPAYDHCEVEARWRRRWQEERTHATDLRGALRPYYNLMMFPYPSAEGLHVGNLFAYTGSDVHGRFRRAQGWDVFEPFGFDAFGIHSENHALRVGGHPARLIPANVARFRGQLERIGARLDWDHAVNSSEPEYYRWTQWLFLQLFRAGLIYRAEAPVNWCPGCRTVLADEQAAGGACERCGSPVEPRRLPQWFARITAYARRLLDGLERLDWSETVKAAQRHWIGRSEGAEVDFAVDGTGEAIGAFTTRPDTLWGASCLVLAPEHPLLEAITAGDCREAVRVCSRAALRRNSVERLAAGREPDGAFTGAWARHPATGARLPVWVADYVLGGYGTGAVMGVPAHDERDFALARRFGLPVVPVVLPPGEVPPVTAAYAGEGTLADSGEFTGMDSAQARNRIAAWLAERGVGRPAVTYRLRDWCLSRQRYWGPPIPVVHCPACGPVPVPEEELPVRLPALEDFAPDGSGASPLARCPEFVRAACPACGGRGRRDTDVSDNFLDSAWYFLRYPSSAQSDVAFAAEVTRKWLPVDMYIGGREHSVLHLMYTRFVTMALHDLGLVDFDEPFRCFRAHGLIVKDGAKMSKSKGNVVNPDEYLDQYGADVLRTYLMFSGPFAQGGDFRTEGVAGVQRFVERLWRYACGTCFADGPVDEPAVLSLVHRQTGLVTQCLEELHYNRAVAGLMELLNGLASAPRHYRQAVRVLLQLSAPFAPFVAQEAWERLGGVGMIEDAGWPQWDPALAQGPMVPYVVQVNGRVRDRLSLPAGCPADEVERAVLARPRVGEWTRGKRIGRVVVVPGKLVNEVVEGVEGGARP